MSRMISIARREMQSYFNSPVAYVVLGVFLLIIGYLYFSTLFLTGFASLRNFFSMAPVLLVVFAPALTMRLIAEERKSGTIEHLLTLPVTDTEVVMGKFLAAMGTVAVGLLMTLPYAVSVAMLAPIGMSMDLGPVIGGYVGLMFLSASFMSLGLLASAVTKNQIVAFVIGLVVCFFFFIVDKFAALMPPTLATLMEFVSVDYHFSNISRGVIDSRDILFYVSLTTIALMLTVKALRKPKSGTIWFLMATVVASLVFANLISLRHFVRVDLTNDGKYTLAKGSKETMRSLDDAMVVTAYFTQGLPAPYASYARHVRDLLEEYRAASNGRLAFEFVDPASEENDEDKQKRKESKQDIFGRVIREPTSVESELVRLGIQPVEIRVIEDDQQQTKRAFMGLIIRHQGKMEVLPVVQDFANFEREMTVSMRKLTRKRTPVVALVSDVALGSISKLKTLIAQTSELKELDAAQLKSIPSDVDALLLVGTGTNLSEDALRAIDAFVVSGKNVGFFVDQHALDPQNLQPNAPREERPGVKLKDLLATYGVSMGSGLVADVQCASLNMQEQRGEQVVAVPVPYPFMPQVASLDQESPITRGLSGVIFPFASPVSVTKDQNLTVALLAQSSKKSWLEAEPLQTDPKREWRADEVKESGPYTLAVDVRGKPKSHFAEGASLSPSAKESRLLVVGTSAFAWDPFFSEENQALAMASIDYLVADEVVIAMRSRSFVDLPLDPELSDEQRSVVKVANILGVPALLVAYGLLRWRRRESRRRSMCLDSI